MRNNPRDWRIEDLKAIARRSGVDVVHEGTSHVVFRHQTAGKVSVPADRPVKPVYVRLFLAIIDKLEDVQ